MNIIAINGSPRKNWNTATLLTKALEGAASTGAETEMINLYDLNFKGCISCFSCKRLGGKSYGKCAVKDELTPVLEKIATADALIFGSPIYLANVTGEARSFLERLVFQYLAYDGKYSSLAPKKLRTACVFTMNVDEKRMNDIGLGAVLKNIESFLSRTFGSGESLYSFDTYQFDDYSKYESRGFDEKVKAEGREKRFPEDCGKAYDLGRRLAAGTE